MRLVTPALLVTYALWPQVASAEVRHFDDAALQAVQFVDAQEGWAVGDEGVVWHSIDGGHKWERQPTGTRASLRDLYFVNPYFGWVVGREELPYGGGSVGVVLFTRDGGLKWHRLLENAMPGLNRVRFVDDKVGFVFGDGSDQFPTGVFKTTDGGKTWEPVPGPRAPSWLAGAFRDGPNGVFAGAWSRLATFRDDRLTTDERGRAVDDLGGRSIRGIAWLSQRALAVGQGGLILTSQSNGKSWGFVNLKQVPEVLQALDFHGIHAVKDCAWVVGRPGSIVLHTADQGASWKMQKTGQPLPLNGVFFRDELTGWAVGEAGTILGTIDGGVTWKVQRQGGKRAAVLCVHARPSDLPVETIAVLAGEEGLLTAGLRVAAPDSASAAMRRASEPMRWAAAIRAAGGLTGETLWQFPLPQHLGDSDAQGCLRHWNRLHNPRGDNETSSAERLLLGQLVLALRLWQPELVLTGSEGPAGALIVEALHEACKQAADPKAFPEHIETLGLTPWTVAKLYTIEEKAQAAQVTVDANEARPQLENTARDFAAAAAGLLHERTVALPAQRSFRLIASRAPEAAQQRGFMDGVAIREDNRRRLPEKQLSDEVKQALRTRRNMETLAENLSDPGKTLAQILPALTGLSDEQGAAAAFAIASQYARRGQWLLAREAFLLMVDRYPAHPLSADAYRWLIRHSSSSEARRRQELGQFLLLTKTQFVQDGEAVPASATRTGPGAFVVPAQGSAEKKDAKERPAPRGTQMIKDSQGTFLADRDESRHWYRGSLEFGKRLASFGPLYASDPSIQFCLQASRRQLGDAAETSEWHKRFAEHVSRGPWHDAAAAELWLTQGGPLPPKPMATCRFTDQKPYLDGNLEDACWKDLKPLVLSNAVADTAKEYPTEAWFAYDQEFLYVAVRCRHPAGKQAAPVKPRPRDADVSAFDRVSILIDLDRDYATCYHLQIDQRGCVREDCWGDLGWNPKWFVAIKSDDDCWQAEAAIPLGELTGDRVTTATVWACNVTRILPGRGVQAWSLPADVEPRPEGMGLLLFRNKR